MKKVILILFTILIWSKPALSATLEPVPAKVKLPTKYTQEYIDTLAEEYKKVCHYTINNDGEDVFNALRKIFEEVNLIEKTETE